MATALVTAHTGSTGLVHKWWERNSPSRDSGWGNWTQTGDDASIAPNTGVGSVAGWNILCPSTDTKRQQLIKTTRQDISFYSRDITSGQPVPDWVKTADQAFLDGTGTLPVVGWSAIEFPSGLIRQQVIRGDELYGYMSWIKYRIPTGAATDWRVDPEWGESVVFGRVAGFNLIHTTGARYIAQILFQAPNTERVEWWQSPEMTDFQELAANNNNPASLGQPSALQVPDEGEQYLSPQMKYSGKSYTVEPGPDNSRNVPGGAPVEVSQVHPYYIMRAYPEGAGRRYYPARHMTGMGSTRPAVCDRTATSTALM
ncbi:MAG: hypothetical protein R3C44_04580 [Chloroflexota bacterium]